MSEVEVDMKNEEGLTAMDVLIRSRRDLRDSEIEHLLKHGDKPTKKKAKKNSWNHFMKQHDVWLEKEKHTLMVVASLIATMAFQAGVDPPEASLSIILLLASGLPIRRRLFMWILKEREKDRDGNAVVRECSKKGQRGSGSMIGRSLPNIRRPMYLPLYLRNPVYQHRALGCRAHWSVQRPPPQQLRG
ncbi:hypothetical protein SASPL_150809 [Salvia splendens]|uniref:PGG domain-containing protein n=1 Tax=Salvia splendens TaxID=180675 RepID=A0A8X8W850_SALSN|nr:hypothetical protein SASPL_150809 [Salvia splendens]